MLSTMLIKNLAVIREMEVQFDRGLNVLTGETGAGKSILMDALQAILGARVSKEMIRSDAKSTLVETAFFFPEGEEPEALEPYLMDGSLILSREIFRDGRNVVKINGSLSNTAILRGLAPYLISIHSQNDNQILFNEELHYRFLDQYAGNEELFENYQECFRKYKDVLGEISRLEEKKEQDNSRIDYLKFVVSEIESANLLPDEEENLKNIKSLMKNKEKNQQNIQTATYALYENEESAYNFLSVAESAVRKVEGLEAVAERLQEIKYEISELSDTVRRHTNEVECDYKNLDDLEDRLALIYQLKMKYGGTFQGVLSYLENAKQELLETENREICFHRLEEQKEAIRKELTALAQELTANRKQSAKKLAEALEAELKDLMMPSARFEIALHEESAFRPYGAEQVQFLFSANAGMPLSPLSKIASGGEVSRVNLALKSVLRGIDPACAFVFDEIDTGLSGRAAQKTGEKMYGISQDSQVLCVTHLPQIAAMADHHILVSKEETQGETLTQVSAITEENRTKELARMLGGVEVTELTYKNAEEMLDLAKKFKLECYHAS